MTFFREKSVRISAAPRRAAFRELVDRGIDRFTVDGVAARADVDHETITAIWHDRRVLLMDALSSSSQSIIPLPDTGTLRGDRGELREGIDPVAATEMFAAATSFDVLFADRPIRPDFVEQVLDVFLHGVSR